MSFNRIHNIIFPCIIAGSLLLNIMSVSATTNLYKQGVQAEEVKQIQTELKKLGFFNSEITGYYGPVTTQAVIAYQKANGFSTDGVVGPATWKVLVGTSQTEVKPIAVSSEFNALLKFGSQGEDVKKVQLKLKEIGYFSDEATGYYGKMTEDAVRRYQTADGTVADGIVGSSTWNSLFGISTLSTPVSVSSSEIMLKNGDKNDDVKKSARKIKRARIL